MSKEQIVVFSGFNQRAVIAFLRTLEKNNIPYSIIALSDNDPIFLTSYKDKVAAVRNTSLLDLADIKKSLKVVVKKTSKDKCFIAPSTEALNRFLLNNREELESMGCIIPLVDKKLYEQISDKKAFNDLSVQNNVKIPKEVSFSENNIPFVVKPKKYELNNDISSPILVFDKATYETINFDFEKLYCQEFLSGKSYYLLYYFSKDGKIIKLAQENLAQQDGGKAIIAAKIIDYNDIPGARKIENLFINAKYNGLVMVEIRIKDNEPCIIEANPRFWGPSQLFVDCGWNLFEYFLQDWGFIEKVTSQMHSAEYYWFGGFKEYIPDIAEKDIYNRTDTFGIFRQECVQNLIKAYNNISKHSQYQILPQNLISYIPKEMLTINSRAEKERLAYILEKLSLKDKTIIDIGANTGFFSFEAINNGAKKVVCYEGNKSHADFINCGISLLNLREKMFVENKYYDFKQSETYNIGFLLNVLHHVGDDYGKAIDMANAKKIIIEQLNDMAFIIDKIVFQLGFNWKGNKNKCLFHKGLKQEIIDYVCKGTQAYWEIDCIGIAEQFDDNIKYVDLNSKNIQREDALGEFLNRPLFIMSSKKRGKNNESTKRR